jgi:nucleoid DNA-binding protein
MIMESISNYISDLLMRQDNVIVPELGGFVARRIPARMSEDGTRVLPPYKQLLFHAHLNLSDGVFERYVAHRSKISLEEAIQVVNSAVLFWNQQLKNGERIELDKVGYLFRDKDNKIRFEQDRAYNLLLQAYGLGEIVFEKTVQEKPQTVTEKKRQQNEELEVVEIQLEPNLAIEVIESSQEDQTRTVLVQDAVSEGKNTRSIWFKVAAAAVLLPFTFYSFWVPMTTDVLETKKLAFSDFNPFHESALSHYQKNTLHLEAYDIEQLHDLDQIVAALPEDALFYNFNYDDELIMPVRLERKAAIQAVEVAASFDNSVSKLTSSGKKIHLISGCFGQKENAENHIQALRELGFDAYLVDVQNGLHRVAALGVEHENELSAASNKLKEREINFWTLKK